MGVRVPPSAHLNMKKLKITKKKISNTDSCINIIIENKDYINPFESRLKELKKRVNLKGFRPGMVPGQLIKKMDGKSVLIEEVNKIISKKITSNNLNISSIENGVYVLFMSIDSTKYTKKFVKQ